jgi:4-carboxymuconolactone decarboxylase
VRSADVAGIAPKFADLTTDVLFGDVWRRPGLARRDRSLITVAALITAYRPEQLVGHFQLALDNGLTFEELVEAITHLAFYAGWPSALSALGLLKEMGHESPGDERSALTSDGGSISEGPNERKS